MARTKKNYTVSEKKKTVSYVLGTLTEEEKEYISEYRAAGYEIIIKSKKSGITLAEMRKALAEDDKALKEFNDIYNEKAKNSFFEACKYFNSWKKNNKTK
jgi:hypothetical protein